MTPKTSGIRKAAILLASLDEAAAEMVLARIDPVQAQQVRQAAGELGLIDPAERQQVIDEFCRVGPLVPQKHPPGIELDGRLAARLGRFDATPAVEAASGGRAEGPPFRFLRDAEADKLAKALAGERAQTVALVLAHLPPEQAGNVLVRLAPPVQVEVVRRLVDLEEADPDILHEVERGLLARLSEQVRVQRRRVAGLAAVQGIVDVSEPRVAQQLLDNLAAHDHRLADRLGRKRLAFDDLLQLTPPSLGAVVRAVDAELLALALIGALPELVQRVLDRLGDPQARIVRRRLENVGPIRLRDVEEARRQIAAQVDRLAIEGRIDLPRSVSPLQRAA